MANCVSNFERKRARETQGKGLGTRDKVIEKSR
jgi:hypothetical protein